MSDPIIAGGTLAPGQIKFYDSIQPPLTAGDYTLKVSQVVTGVNDAGQTPQYDATQKFRVDGPRFQLDPNAIHGVYPPANQEGDYYGQLPHIVFKDFALPWSRKLDPRGAEDDATPWMGLLTVYADEMPPVPPATQPAGRLTAPATVPVAQVTAPGDPSILPPVLPDLDTSTDQKALVVDVDLAFFRAIAPKAGELKLLAHAREVNTDGKVLLGMADDGCFSVVVGNRVPKRGSVNYAFLVSLEGHQQHLPGGGDIPAQYRSVRLVVLGNWRYTARETPGSFLYLMSRLCDTGFGGVKLLQLPKAPSTDAEPTAKEALEIGFVPLRNDMRVGERTTSWYRGPLVAAPTAPDNAYGPYRYSDHAMHYDPETGLFNQAYAAAWQIGRLLALSDGNYARRLFDWKRKHFATQQQASDQRDVEGRVAPALALTAEPLPTGTGLSRQVQNFMVTQVHPMLDEFPRVVPRGQEPELAELPGVLAPEEVADILETDADPLQALRNKLKDVTNL